MQSDVICSFYLHDVTRQVLLLTYYPHIVRFYLYKMHEDNLNQSGYYPKNCTSFLIDLIISTMVEYFSQI